MHSADNFRKPYVKNAISAVWDIIENGGKEAVESLVEEEMINTFRSILENVIQNGFKLEDKGMRNELCILVN